MIAVLYATRQEADPFLKTVQAAPLPGFNDRYVDAKGQLVIGISGMGPAKAAACTRQLLTAQPVGLLVNAGIAGALHDGAAYRPGTVFQVNRVSFETAQDTEMDLPLRTGAPWPHLPAVGLVTVDQPVFEFERRQMLARHAALVDMEGAMVAKVAHERGVSCHLLKAVSDSASPGDKKQLWENLPRVCRQLATSLQDGLEQLTAHAVLGKSNVK